MPRARVYRHLDTKSTTLGLAFPDEWGMMVVPLLCAIVFDQWLVGFLLDLALYVTIRIAGFGKPERFFVHWIQFQIRRAAGGFFSAAARARRTPRFPFARYVPNRRLDHRMTAALKALHATAATEGGTHDDA